jgi:hypothetical protein
VGRQDLDGGSGHGSRRWPIGDGVMPQVAHTQIFAARRLADGYGEGGRPASGLQRPAVSGE